MLRKTKAFVQSHKITVLLVLLFLAIALTSISMMTYPNRHRVVQPSFSLSAPSSSLPLPTTSSASITPVTEPTVGPLQPTTAPSPSASPLSNLEAGGFQYVPCSTATVMNPDAHVSSAFKPAKQPDGPLLENISYVSASHLFDQAGYGMNFGASYALAKDGTLYRWGITGFGSGKHPGAFPQEVVGIPAAVVQLDGRYALAADGYVYDLNAEHGVQRIQALSGIVQIAQAEESSVYALGKAGNVQLQGFFGPSGEQITRQLHGLEKVKTLSAGPHLALMLSTEGTLWKLPLGSGDDGVLIPTAITMPNGESPKRIEATMSYQNQAYIQSDKDHWYRLNDQGDLIAAVVPSGAIQVTATEETSVALLPDGTVWIWGATSNFLDLGGEKEKLITPEAPRQLAGLSNIAAITTGSNHLLALTADGHVKSVGSNMYGQLGRKPIFASEPFAIGTWPGLDQLFPAYDRLYAIQDGDVWSLDANGDALPALMGQHAKQVLMALGHYAVLSEDGHLYVANPETAQPCRMLSASEPIASADAARNGVLVALENGRAFHITGNFRQVDTVSELQFEPKPVGKVTQVFGDPIPFALTDKGELYYRDHFEKGLPIMKLAMPGVTVKQWSPMHDVFFDSIGFVGKALDAQNQVYKITLKLNRQGESVQETASVQVQPTDEKAERITGGAIVTADGHIHEEAALNDTTIDTRLPTGVKLRAAASLYHFPIECRSFFYHIFLTEEGTLYWLGDTPYTGLYPKPENVRLPAP